MKKKLEKKLEKKKEKKLEKKPKKITTTQLKKKAWTVFSIFIRKKNSNSNGDCKCVTCGGISHWKKMQAGHYVGGRNNTVLFNEKLVFPQCYRCNVILKGNYAQYTLFMLDKGYTKDEIQEMLYLKSKVRKWKPNELKEIEIMYKDKIKHLEQI